MIQGAINWVGDAQLGSTGKGLINSYLAWKYRPEIISCTNQPNAGHTAILPDGTRFIAKALPSSTILNHLPDYNPEVVVGASSGFTIDQLQKEMAYCVDNDNNPPKLTIHPRAGVVTTEHAEIERGEQGTKHIASTMQGSGACMSQKIMRRPEVKLARDYQKLHQYMPQQYAERINYIDKSSPQDMGTQYVQYLPQILMKELKSGKTILHEGSQGFGLDIHHGVEYPYCTSRQCTVLQSVADMGLPHQMIGDVYLVMRPYPIRVGNVVEKDQTVGHSGGIYPDSEEITWAEVARNAGAPLEIANGELTTVTGRIRRVFKWSDTLLERSIAVNGATKIALNFANYIDWSSYGVSDWDQLSPKIIDWIKRFEDRHQIEIALVGTGPRVDHVCSK